MAVAALLALGAAITAAHVRGRADTAAGVGIELLRRIALRTDALIVAAGRIICANRSAFAEHAHFTASAGMAAATAVLVVALRVDTVIIALGLGVGALTLAKLAGAPRIAGMATGTTIVGIGVNGGALPTAADLVGGPQAAISGLAVVQPHLKHVIRVHPAAEARDEHRPIVAEVVAGGVFIEKEFANRGVLAIGDATTGCGSARSAK